MVEGNSMGYTALKLSEQSRAKLLESVPVAYEQTVCDHITLGMMKEEQAQKDYSTAVQSVQVLGIADDGQGIQALVISVDDSIQRKHDGKILHVTHSLNPNAKAPKEFDVFAKTPEKAKEKPYKPATANGLLKQLFDEEGNLQVPRNDTWTYKTLSEPITIDVQPVYVEGQETKPLIAPTEAKPSLAEHKVRTFNH